MRPRARRSRRCDVPEVPGTWNVIRLRLRNVQDVRVRLTFDDGPDPRFTPLVLDALAELGVTATFYCVGRRALAWPELVRRIAAEGHAVGSHTMTHPDLSTLDPLQAIGNVRDGRRAVEKALGAPVRRFRAPFGRLGAPGKIALAVCRLEHEGWDVDPEDWRPEATPAAIAGDARAPRAPTTWCCCTTARSRRSTRAASTARRRSGRSGCSPERPAPTVPSGASPARRARRGGRRAASSSA